MYTFFSKHRTEKGFTLIELLVVIAIIGVLSSVVLASLNNARRKSRDVRRIADIKQIQLALELYFDGAGSNQYPASSITCSGATNYGLEVLVTNGYIPQIPHDPSSSTTCYKYASLTAGTRNTYHLGGALEDTGNQALTGDRDFDSATPGTYTNGFSGLGINTLSTCGAAGTAQPGGTELCYDVTP